MSVSAPPRTVLVSGGDAEADAAVCRGDVIGVISCHQSDDVTRVVELSDGDAGRRQVQHRRLVVHIRELHPV